METKCELWRVGDAGHTIFGPKTADGSMPRIIATVKRPCDARQIAREHNSHAALLEACKQAAEVLRVQLDYDPEEGSAEWVAHDTLLAAIAQATGQDGDA